MEERHPVPDADPRQEPQAFYWVPDDGNPTLLDGEWCWIEAKVTPPIKDALLALRRGVRTDGWPLVVELSKRPLLRQAVDALWDWQAEHPDELRTDDDAWVFDCQRAWRGTELMAELADRQLEMVIGLLPTWSGPLEAAIETAVQLSEA